MKNIRAIATAACREAADGPAFIQRGEKVLGTRIQVLSGQQEAELAANGIIMGFRSADGLAGDLGGGSLELIDVEGTSLRQAVTLPLGGLRLIDSSGGRIDKALDIADAQIASVGWLDRGRNRTFYAVGGTWRAIAKLHMEQTELSAARHARLQHADQGGDRRSARTSARPRSSPPCTASRTSPSRGARCCPMAPWCWSACSRGWSPREVRFSVFGIREGLVYSLMSESERRKDPLLSFCAEFARQRSRDAEHAIELCTWTDALFEGPGPKETDEERRLRHAACLLSDIGWRAHPDYRGEQSLILIAHAALAGIDHPGRVFLALCHLLPPRRHRRRCRGRDEQLSERLKAIVSKKQFRRARIIGAAIRAAHMLSIGRSGIIDETPLELRGRQAGADHPQGPCGAGRRAPAPPIRRPGRPDGTGAGSPRRPINRQFGP